MKKIDDIIKDLLARETLTSEESQRQLSIDFKKKKKRLPSPVLNAFVSSKFGKQKHPVLKWVEVDNQGINLQTSKGEAVRAVFRGIVATVAYVPGMNNVVILRHGNYYTLYARLGKMFVKRGEVVRALQSIGEVHTDAKGTTEMHFQVWKNDKKMDPEDWINTVAQ